MNICMVSQYLPRVGGIENIVSDLSKRLAAEGHEIHVVAPAGPGSAPDGLLDGVHVHRFSGTNRRFPFRIDRILAMKRKIEEVSRRFHVDIIHAHFAKNEGLVSTFAGRKLGIPVITTCHGTDLMFSFGGICEKAWGRYWVRRALHRSNAVTTVSEALRRNAWRLGIEKGKVEVIHNWIDAAGFAGGDREELRRELGIGDMTGNGRAVRIILTARRLVPKNGVDLLVEAVRKLGNPCRLLIIGEGPECPRLREQAARHEGTGECDPSRRNFPPAGRRMEASVDTPQKNTVEFLGFRPFDEYVKYLRAADVLVIPSRWEGFGMAALEAMSARTPVIATNVGGLPEIIRHGENGILVEPDPQAIAAGIDSLLDDTELAERLTRAAFADVSERFSWERARNRYLGIYQRVLDEVLDGTGV